MCLAEAGILSQLRAVRQTALPAVEGAPLLGAKGAWGCDVFEVRANHSGMSTPNAMQAEFLALVQENRGLIYKVSRAYGLSAADRDDLAQEIIMNLWRAYPRYDRRFKLSTWMYRIALNVAISWQRRELTQTRHRAQVRPELLQNIPQLDAQLNGEDVALLYAAIAGFDELDRALLLLYLDGRAHQETAEVLGMTPTHVATRLGRLKERLRERFRVAGHLEHSPTSHSTPKEHSHEP